VLDAIEAREIAKVLKLFRQVRRELSHPRACLNSVWYEPEALVRVDGEIERAPRIFVSALREPRLAQTTPVLALDGTGSIELNRQIFGDETAHERFPAPRDAEVWQVMGKTFSRQSITGADRRGNPINAQKVYESTRLRRQVIDLLKMLPGQVLLVTYKAAEETLRLELPPHVRTAHFGALRGLNSYEDCDTVIVMGREQPSAEAIEKLTRPFCATDAEPFIPIGEFVVQSRGRRMREDGPNVVEVQVHPDPRCQAVLEQVREAEIAQAIDRVRPVFNRRRIIVLTSIVLDLTVDHARTWPELRPGKFADAFGRHGVLPLSASDLCRGFPDLWRSENTAKSDLKRKGLIGCNPQIINLFGICTPLNQTHLKATYRRQGQRGKAAHALVSAAVLDPRAALESLVGELAEFEVEDEPPAAKVPEPPPPLRPLAAALSAEGRMLATLPADQRPPDMLGMARAMKLMALAADTAGAAWAGVA
jgi:hypothetical protein